MNSLLEQKQSLAELRAHLFLLEAAEQQSRDFGDWLNRVSPAYNWQWPHIQYVRRHLDNVTSGACRRLIIQMPPRHGKSELATIRYPVYRLEREPATRVIVGAYSQTLAEKFSRRARRIALTRLQLSKERNSAEDWETTAGGGFRAVGVGGGVTGQGADLIVVDDPVKNREEAESLTYRDKVWDWFTNDLFTRQEPGCAIIVIMCMTGNTPVLMADGTERPLREIQVGDEVATYDNGKLKTATVRNHKNNGPDSVYRIRTTCGRVVHANERHPFLVEEHGELKWLRLKDLTTAHKIVTVKDSGASGRERPVPSRVATSLLSAGDTARRTTTKRCGPMGIVPNQTIQSHAGTHGSSTATESQPLSTTLWSRRKGGSALSANSPQATMYERIGPVSCALTTTTTPILSEDFCATTAIWPWDTPSQKQPRLPLPNTSDFTTEQIASITPAGVEDVFDIQIDRTENFIANGVVSHNTRWHKDDLVGRILESETGKDWDVISLPAEAEAGDALGRSEGAALCPDRYPLPALAEIHKVLGRDYFALYQQRPQPREGGMFKDHWFKRVEAVPAEARRVRWWDMAATADGGDWTVGLLVVEHEGIYTLADVVRGQWSSGERDKIIRQTAANDAATYGAVTVWGGQEPGSAGKDAAGNFIKLLAGYDAHTEPETGPKEVRAQPLAAQAEAGNVAVLKRDWTSALIDEFCNFPSAAHDDQVDAGSHAFNKLALGIRMGSVPNTLFD